MCSVLFVGIGAADGVSGTENTTVTTQSAVSTTLEVVYVHTETKDTYRFESGDPDLSTVPDGEYLEITYTQQNGTVDKHTRDVTITDGEITPSTKSDSGIATTGVETDAVTEEIELVASVKGEYDYAYGPNATVAIRVGAINTTTSTYTPANKSVSVDIRLPNGTTTDLTTTTTGTNGTTVVEYNLSDRPDGEYDVYISPSSDDGDAFGYASFSAGARALLADSLDPQLAQLDRETTVAVHTKVEGAAAPNRSVSISIIAPDGSNETHNVTTGADAFALQTFTPTQTGRYEVEARGPNGETTFFRTIQVGNYTAQMAIPQNFQRFPNETVSLPGTIVNQTGSPLAQETLELEVLNDSGVVVHNETVTTNAGGQFIGDWTTPTAANLSDNYQDYNIRLTTAGGERIATNGEIEVEYRPTTGGGDGPSDEPNVSVDVRTDQSEYDPSGTVTATLEVTENGTPVNNTTVSLLSTVDGPAIDYRTVQTNTTGMATVSTSLPSSVANYHNKDLRVRAATTVNGTTYTDTAFGRLITIDTDIESPYSVVAGATETGTVSATNLTGAAQANVPISYVALQSGFHTSVLDAGTVQTNQTGVAPYSVAIPADSQGEVQFTYSARGEDFNRYTTPQVQQYSVDVTVGEQDEYVRVPPGDQVSISYSSEETNITSGIVAVSTYDDTADQRVLTVETLDAGTITSVSIPDVDGETYYSVDVYTVNESGIVQSANGYIDVDPEAEPLRDTVTVSGTVTEADGTAAANDTIATVFEESTSLDPAESNGATTTNEDGSYDVSLWTNLTHDLEYYQENASQIRSGDEVVFPRDGSVDVYAIDRVNTSSNLTIDQQLPEGHVLNITVQNESGAPIEDARVTIRHRNGEADAQGTTKTEANGMINVSTAPGIELNGTVDLVVKPPANDPRYQNQTLNDTLTITSDTSRTFTLNETTVTVSGTLNESDGSPAANDTVVTVLEDETDLDPVRPGAVTESDGSYDVPIWANFTHDLRYYQQNLTAFNNASQITFPRDDTVDIYALDRVNTSSDITISEQLPRGHTLNVTVVNESGDPVEGARIGIRHRNGDANATWGSLANANGKLDANGTTPGVELNGTVDLIVAPPENSTQYQSQVLNETLTITSDTSRTFTLNENESVTVDADANGSASGSVGDVVTVDILVQNSSAGDSSDGTLDDSLDLADSSIDVGSFEASISLTNPAVGSIENVSFAAANESTVSYGTENDSVQVFANGINTSAAEVRVLTFDIRLDQTGSTRLSLSETTVTTPTGGNLVIAANTSDVITATEIGPIGQSSSAPTDLDGDGTFEDVDGDGEITSNDLDTLFENRNSEAVQNNPEQFDFSGNGQVNVVDIQALYAQEYLPTQF